MGEGQAIGRAVALHHDAAQTDEAGAVVAAVIDAILEALDRRHREQRAGPGDEVAVKFFAEELADHFRETLRCLQRDVADEAVADDDVDRPTVDVVAFDVAVEVEIAGLEQLARFLDDIAALDVFLADVKQADGGTRLLLGRFDQRAAHHRELIQMLGGAIDIGAEVEHRGVAADRRQPRRDRRALDAGQRLQYEVPGRHQRAGVAGAHAGGRSTFLHQVDGDPHRRIFLAAKRQRRLFVHFDDLRRRADRDAQRLRAGAGQMRLDGVTEADQDHARIGMRLQEIERGRHRDRRAEIPTHRIDGDGDRARGAIVCANIGAVSAIRRNGVRPICDGVHSGLIRHSLDLTRHSPTSTSALHVKMRKAGRPGRRARKEGEPLKALARDRRPSRYSPLVLMTFLPR